MRRVHRFGDLVTTDDILPGKYLDRPTAELGPCAMSGIDPDFASKVTPGDVIVAGRLFGMGSGRESAPAALKQCGIDYVIAPSFARLFYRNAINLGLAAVMVDDVIEGDEVEVDLARRVVEAAGKSHPIKNLTGTALAVLEAGGIVPFTKQRRRA